MLHFRSSLHSASSLVSGFAAFMAKPLGMLGGGWVGFEIDVLDGLRDFRFCSGKARSFVFLLFDDGSCYSVVHSGHIGRCCIHEELRVSATASALAFDRWFCHPLSRRVVGGDHPLSWGVGGDHPLSWRTLEHPLRSGVRATGLSLVLVRQ